MSCKALEVTHQPLCTGSTACWLQTTQPMQHMPACLQLLQHELLESNQVHNFCKAVLQQ